MSDHEIDPRPAPTNAEAQTPHDPATVPSEPAALPAEPLAPGPARPRDLKLPILIGALLLTAGLWLVFSTLPSLLGRPEDAAPATPPAAAPEARRIQATLFYVSDDGSELVPVSRDVAYGETPIEQARHILEAQVRTPAGFASAIPAGTTVRGLFLGARGEAYVDLSADVVTGHTGGSLDEALAVFAVVNAVTSNLPDVTAVQILVDGKEVDSLAGHLDLRQPISRANAWISIRKGQ